MCLCLCASVHHVQYPMDFRYVLNTAREYFVAALKNGSLTWYLVHCSEYQGYRVFFWRKKVKNASQIKKRYVCKYTTVFLPALEQSIYDLGIEGRCGQCVSQVLPFCTTAKRVSQNRRPPLRVTIFVQNSWSVKKLGILFCNIFISLWCALKGQLGISVSLKIS